MNSDWKKVKIKDFTKVLSGGTPKSSVEEYYSSGEIGWITPSDLTKYNGQFISKGKKNITGLGLEKSSAKLLPPGTVLFSSRAPIGHVVIAEKELTTNQGFKNILPSPMHDPKYLYWYLKSIKSEIEFRASGTTFKEISGTAMGEIEILLPPLKEQKKIVAVLDKAQALIAKRKEVILNLDKLVRSVFLDMFGDPVINPKKINKVKLDELGDWKSGGTPPRKKDEYYKGDVPWYSSGELNNTYISKSIECISHKAIDETSAKLIKPGSLLLGMYDTAALKSSISTQECSCNQAIAFSKLNEELVSTLFVYYVIQLGKDHYKRQQRGVRQKNLNLTMIREIEVILPPLGIQQEFVDLVEKIEQQKLTMQKSLVILENIFQSLLRRAFQGELEINTKIVI